MKCILYIVLLAAAICLTSCRTVRVIEQVPVYLHDTTQAVREVHDSTYIDRWHTVVVSGDTVVIHDSVDRWHSVVLRDTVREVCEVPVEVTVEVPVAKPLTWWQQTKQGGFWVLLVMAVGLIARKFRSR